MPTTAADIVNKKSCELASRKGTGTKHCFFNEKTPKKPFYSKRGFDWASIADLTDAGIAKEIQRSNIFVMPKSSNFERVTEENVRTNSNTGDTSVARKGLYRYVFTWDHDSAMQEVVSSFEGQDHLDYAMVDASGNVKLTKNGNKLQGASVGLIDANPFMEATGAESSRVSMFMELSEPEDYNKYPAYLAAENIPSRLLKLEGVNDVVLTLTSFVAGASRSINFDAFLKDGTTAFQGGVTADFKFTFDGAVGAGTITENSPGKYTYTEAVALASGAVIKISTWDDTEKTVNIIKDVTSVYRGPEVTEVVA